MKITVAEDDPLVNAEYRKRARNLGGSGIIRLTKDDKAVWRGTRDLVLPASK